MHRFLRSSFVVWIAGAVTLAVSDSLVATDPSEQVALRFDFGSTESSGGWIGVTAETIQRGRTQLMPSCSPPVATSDGDAAG